MGATTRGGLPYPEEGDEVYPPADIQELAEAIAPYLFSADRKSSTTRPTLASGDRGYLVDESDTGNLVRWNGSTWVAVGGSAGGGGGGGGGGAAFGGRWKAATAQPIPATVSGPGTPVKFDTDPVGGSGVEKSTYLAGHMFELTAAGLWTGGLIGRWASTTVSGIRDFGIYCDRAGGTDFEEALTGPQPQTVTGQPKGGTWPIGRYLPAGTTLVAFAYNGTGSGRNLEHNGGEWVSLDLWVG